MLSKMQLYLRQNTRAVIATSAFCLFVLIISSDVLHDSRLGPGYSIRSGTLKSDFAGTTNTGYFSVEKSRLENAPPFATYRFAAVTDLDQLSAVKEAKKATFRSVILPGTITRNDETKTYTVAMEPTREVRTQHNEGGRGAEFSELTVFNDHLLTFDDRTGEVFEILNEEDGKKSFVAPRYVITEGDGDTDKGMKWEWATVKDGQLYMGSMGKEYTRPDGSIANTNNLWVTILNQAGQLRRVDWSSQFKVVRDALGAKSPGYVIHEAVNWSPHLRKWVFAPRRISKEAYDEDEDEKRGSNKLVLVDENFRNAQVVTVKMASKDGLHGFSSFAFVPGTKDTHALAIRSVEENCTGDLDLCKQRSYLVIFDVLTGDVLMDEIQIPEPMKYEGIEFVDMYTKPPKKAIK